MRTIIISMAATCFAVTLSATPATAKDILADMESPLSGLYACAKIDDATQRLNCFDKMAASLQQAEENKEIVAIDAQAAKKIKKEAFGFNIPSLPKLGLPKIGGDKKIDSVSMKIKSIQKIRRKYVITFENGQVWEESGGRLNYVPKGELTGTIKPKSMGSFMITIHKGKTKVRGLRVRRIK